MNRMFGRQRIYTRSNGTKASGDFVCMHCGAFVPADAALSGVRNRNHCPYCLSSRHLDHFAPGDRLSACKGRMRAVALTLKNTTKKYARPGQGELMLIHRCEGCGKISINRIAADDDADGILALLEAEVLPPLPEAIVPLDARHLPLVRAGLLGRG